MFVIFRHFTDNFKGSANDSGEPLKQYLSNTSSCKPYAYFIKSELLERRED